MRLRSRRSLKSRAREGMTIDAFLSLVAMADPSVVEVDEVDGTRFAWWADHGLCVEGGLPGVPAGMFIPGGSAIGSDAVTWFTSDETLQALLDRLDPLVRLAAIVDSDDDDGNGGAS